MNKTTQNISNTFIMLALYYYQPHAIGFFKTIQYSTNITIEGMQSGALLSVDVTIEANQT